MPATAITASAEPDQAELELDGPPPLAPGAELAPDYLAIEHIRRGEHFDAYDAWSESRHCRCVLKVLRPDCTLDAGARAGLMREGRLLLSLAHPHLVRAYELIRPAGPRPPALVLETLSGATLSCLLDESPHRLAVEDVGHLGRHLCSAIRYLHRQGFLHLDVKPSNIVATEGRARLLDLGIARRPGPCRAGRGTRGYMSPEQVRGGNLGPAADVWGVGLTLYEAATGHQPFAVHRESPNSGSRVAESGQPERFAQLVRSAPRLRARRRLPRPVVEVIDACLRRDPAERPSLRHLDGALATLVAESEAAPIQA